MRPPSWCSDWFGGNLIIGQLRQKARRREYLETEGHAILADIHQYAAVDAPHRGGN
jgi:hypothetical protein